MENEAQKKYAVYAALIVDKIKELFEEDAIPLEELEDEENFQAFFHAFASVAPCSVFNTFNQSTISHIEFNHIANKLCAKNMTFK